MWYSQSGDPPRGEEGLAQFGYKSDVKLQTLKSCFYIFDYLLEPITEIWWLLIFFSPNFGDWNLKKKTLHFWIFDFEFHFLVKLWQLKKKGLLGCKTMTHSFTYVVVNLYLYILSWVTVHLNTISVRAVHVWKKTTD